MIWIRWILGIVAVGLWATLGVALTVAVAADHDLTPEHAILFSVGGAAASTASIGWWAERLATPLREMVRFALTAGPRHRLVDDKTPGVVLPLRRPERR